MDASTFLILAAQSGDMISVDFFKWACLGLVAAIGALAKAYIAQGKAKDAIIKEKDDKISDLNDKMLTLNKECETAVQDVHKQYHDKIEEIVDRKEATIDMIRNAKEQSDAEAFEKITSLLKAQTEIAVSHQAYTDKMMSILEEAADKLDDIEPLLTYLANLISENNDIKSSFDAILDKLKEMTNAQDQ